MLNVPTCALLHTEHEHVPKLIFIFNSLSVADQQIQQDLSSWNCTLQGNSNSSNPITLKSHPALCVFCVQQQICIIGLLDGMQCIPHVERIPGLFLFCSYPNHVQHVAFLLVVLEYNKTDRQKLGDEIKLKFAWILVAVYLPTNLEMNTNVMNNMAASLKPISHALPICRIKTGREGKRWDGCGTTKFR